MNARRMRLKKLLIKKAATMSKLSDSTCCTKDDDMIEVVKVTKLSMDLDWKLSACGVFDVNRKLLCGVNHFKRFAI
jgi:hypothetical protein